MTLDKDHNTNSGPASPPGDETMTITKVRSGAYSYSVFNSTDKDNDTANYKTNFSKSNAKVKVFYNKMGLWLKRDSMFQMIMELFGESLLSTAADLALALKQSKK